MISRNKLINQKHKFCLVLLTKKQKGEKNEKSKSVPLGDEFPIFVGSDLATLF
jgi:hypothetical protein